MDIIGFDFICDFTDVSSTGFSPMAVSNEDYTDVQVANAVVDGLYITKNTDVPTDELQTEWDYDTIINANYNGNYRGGNIDFTVEETDFLRLKVKDKDGYNWITLVEFPVETKDDLQISFVDRYRNSEQDLEYAIVPVTDNTEGNYSTAEVKSEFEGIVVAESDISYRAFAYDEVEVTRNNSINYITTLSHKYPYSIINARYNYATGTISAGFYPLVDNEIDLSYSGIIKYRETVVDFLTNGKPKVLKLDDGRSWIVNIDAGITIKPQSEAYYIEFGFTQIGDSQSTEDLYNAGLSKI